MILEEIAVLGLIEESLNVKGKAAKARAIDLEASVDDPKATVRGDRRLLRTAVTNLIDAAIRHNHPGGKVTVGYRSDADRESFVVESEGGGIPYEELRSMHDLFCRAANPVLTDGEEIDASLLGLSIVRDIADLHGGRIGVRSTEGEGSVFTLHLPRRHRGAA